MSSQLGHKQSKIVEKKVEDSGGFIHRIISVKSPSQAGLKICYTLKEDCAVSGSHQVAMPPFD